MPIGALGIVLWEFSCYFWNAPRTFTLELSAPKNTDYLEKKHPSYTLEEDSHMRPLPFL